MIASRDMNPTQLLSPALALAGLLCSSLGTLQANAQSASLAVDGLRCEYRTNPVGLDVTAPRLSWTLSSERRGERQTAYQILVASSPDRLASDQGNLWDTGKVRSDQTLHVVYGGKALPSRMRVWWKVRVWDREGQPSAWSASAQWVMGLLERSDWQAKWITDPESITNVAARGPLNGYHSQTTNTADVVKWVTIDLGQAQEFDAVRLFPARPYDWQPDTPGFLFPVRFRIEGATQADFSDARVLVNRTAADELNPGTNAPTYRFASATARFVRLTATRLAPRDDNNFAFALAEMEVLSGETNLGKGAKAVALDSIETGPWAAANLTDGVVATVKPESAPGALPATLVRKSFTLPGSVRHATAYATALGLYELRINGQCVGDQLLAPEWTDYRKRIQYQTHDVAALLRPGENAIGALLGEGWYAGRLMAMPRFAYGSYPRFLLQVEIELADGRKQTVVTDDSWRSTTDGPIRAAGIYDGEAYDARKEMPGWDAPAFDAASWRSVQSFEPGPEQLVWQRNEPIEVTQELTPIKMSEPKPAAFVFDLGQNLVGWCRVRAQGSAGQTITIRHAEMLHDDGTLYTANLRGAPQVDRYTPRADGEFVFEPHFTYHGFRFVELTGLAQPPASNTVLARVFHSASPVVGQFECSDSSLNELMRNILWTQRANLMSSPNDCPQRDERFGWMGDIQAFAQTAIFNMDLAAFFTKFAQDIRDGQADDGRFPDFAPHPGNANSAFSGAPAWADAGVIVPWRAFQNYADLRLLGDHFEAARRWVDFVRAQNPGLIWVTSRGNDYNDWLNGNWIKQQGWPTEGASVPKEVFATAFFAHSTELVAKMAVVLGRTAEAQRYGELAARIKAAFREKFVKPDGRIEGDTQGGYALALNFDLLPDEIRPLAAQHLVEDIHRYRKHLSTGIQTTHRAMLELARYGHNDLAWQLLTNRTFPSWLYMIDNGATTMWERWDGYVKGRGFQDAGMNSFNHWAFGAVGEWMWREIAGLNPDHSQPGWKHFTVAPRPGGGVTWARGRYDSIRGPIMSAWQIADGVFRLEVAIPPNTTAAVVLPAKASEAITESGRPLDGNRFVSVVQRTGDRAILTLESGRYAFEVGTRSGSALRPEPARGGATNPQPVAALRRVPPTLAANTSSPLRPADSSSAVGSTARDDLAISVYATAGDVLQHLAPVAKRDATLAKLRPLGVTRVFLEGRRGDECVPPGTLAEVRDFLVAHGIRGSGGIATVPGSSFGTRQTGGLDWLNWESEKTRSDIAAFFREDAPVFDELIVDDFFCTGDTSLTSERARGGRTWSQYRRDLLVSLIEPLMLQPAREQRPDVRLIIKFPQWYDRFHLFGYDPARMSVPFDQVWVGTEVRNPLTRRMGFVQPTEGYLNFRWLSSVCGAKTTGAWFDHIECTPENFVDQAYQSVLAGARELTLFRLGDLVAGHPGDELLARRWPELMKLARKVQGRMRHGIPFYKPPNSDAADNLYLMDCLGMIGLPILPEARYREDVPFAVLGAQAAADPGILERVNRHLRRGATILMTPAFLRCAGAEFQPLAGASVGEPMMPEAAREIRSGSSHWPLPQPLEVDASLTVKTARVLMSGQTQSGEVPVLVERRQGRGRILVLNTRTFSEDDFRSEGEWLLSPKPRGLSELPQAVADELRRVLRLPGGVELRAPAGVGLYLFDGAGCLYNFRDGAVQARLNGKDLQLPPHDAVWIAR
jgi:alpha-L-rhamnosidase